MKYIKKFNETKSSDYTIFKIRYYADGIDVVKGKFDGDDNQHWERAQEYNKFFWEMVEKVTGYPHKYWALKYLLSSRECATEELHDKYDIIIPESEEYYYWYIPKSMSSISKWVEENCKLPFKIVIKSPYGSSLNREKTDWRRKESEEFTKKHL